MWRPVLKADLVAGLLIAVFGVAVLVVSRNYPVGTLRAMAPGFMPRALGWLCIGLGLVILARGAFLQGAAASDWNLRGLAAVVSGIVLFSLLIERAGLVLATIIAVATVSLAQPGARVGQIAALAVFLAVATTAIFIIGLGLPLSMGPRP